MQHPVNAADFDRAVRTADRMLRGAGAASATLFRLDGQPVLDAFVQDLLPDGRLALVLAGAAGIPDQAEARIDLVLEAPEPGLRIVAASAHLLVRLEWHDGGCAVESAAVAEAAGIPGARVALAAIETVLVHDVTGVTRIDAAALAAAPTTGPGTADLAEGIDRDRLTAIALGVATGLRPGRVLSVQSTPGDCSSMAGTAFVIDADAQRVTAMLIGSGSATVVDIAAAEVACDFAQAAR